VRFKERHTANSPLMVVCKGHGGGGPMRSWLLAAALLLSAHPLPAPIASSALHGSWTATAGSTQVFWGTWTARVSPDKPNLAQGSWALLSKGGETLLEGTWSAQKDRTGWQGAWAARTLQGRSFSGTWTADLTGLSGKTFKQMLEWTVEKDIIGSWRSGRYEGNWRLKGVPPPRGQDR